MKQKYCFTIILIIFALANKPFTVVAQDAWDDVNTFSLNKVAPHVNVIPYADETAIGKHLFGQCREHAAGSAIEPVCPWQKTLPSALLISTRIAMMSPTGPTSPSPATSRPKGSASRSTPISTTNSPPILPTLPAR